MPSKLTPFMVLLMVGLMGCPGGGGGGNGGGANGFLGDEGDWSDFSPYLEGDFWEYNTHSASVESPTEPDGSGCARIRRTGQAASSDQYCWFGGGLYLTSSQGQGYRGTYSPPFLLLPRNSDIGQTVTRSYGLTTVSQGYTSTMSGQISVTIEEYPVSVTVPAGTFDDCIRVRSDGSTEGTSFSYTGWYARGVGFVKSVSQGSNTELISYRSGAG